MPLVVLIGPPGAGKSAVGPLLADRLGVEFRDTDADIEDVAGMTVADLFVQYGEEHFRALEEQAVSRALAEHDGVIDFEAAVRDPSNPARTLPAYDFDGVHMTDAGYEALANAINLTMLF